jgi:hypothetical protein
MQHARSVIEAWRIEYNTERPHSSLDDLTPEEFRHAHASPGSVGAKPNSVYRVKAMPAPLRSIISFG